MAPAAPIELVSEPGVGRVFTASRRVGLGDASPAGRVRFDALARFLQDIANECSRDAGLDQAFGWVVRRTWIEVETFPVYGELVSLRTWCSGIGGRWAERRTSISGDSGGHVEAAALWVHIDVATGRPAVMPEAFHTRYGTAAVGRKVRASLVHRDPPAEAEVVNSWRPGFCEYDVMGHVNNASYWARVEEMLAARRDLRAPLVASVEHREALGPGALADLVAVQGPSGLEQWVVEGGSVKASALVDLNGLTGSGPTTSDVSAPAGAVNPHREQGR